MKTSRSHFSKEDVEDSGRDPGIQMWKRRMIPVLPVPERGGNRYG
jgi:hypothetical protein